MEKEEELFIPKTKHKGLKITLAIILILGLIAAGYFLYQYKFNNPKVLVNNVLEEAERTIDETIKETDNNSMYYVDGHIKIDSNINDNTFKILKDVETLFNGQIDSNEGIANLNFNTKYKNDKLVDFNLYYENSIIYLLLDGVYDKYIKINTNKSDETSSFPQTNISPKDMKTIISSVVKSLRLSLDKQEFKKTDASISINGNSIDVIDNYVELKDKEVNNLMKDIFTNLKDNQEFINTIKNITDEDGKTIIDEIIKSFDEEEFKGIYRIDFYTDKSLLNKKIISVRQTITILGETLNINVDKLSDDEIAINMIMPGISYTARIKKTNSVINLLLNFRVGEEYLNFDISLNYESIKEVTKPDVSKNKDIDKITEKEQNEIKNKLKENQNLLKLLEELNKIGKQEA